MNKKDFLKIAGVSTEEEFYNLYPSPESFFEKFKKASYGISTPPDKLDRKYRNSKGKDKYDEHTGKYFSDETIEAFKRGDLAFPSYINSDGVTSNSVIYTTQPSDPSHNLYGGVDEEIYNSASEFYRSAFPNVDLGTEEGAGDFQRLYSDRIPEGYKSGFVKEDNFRGFDKKTGRYTTSRPIPIKTIVVEPEDYESFSVLGKQPVIATTYDPNDKIYDYSLMQDLFGTKYGEIPDGQFYRVVSSKVNPLKITPEDIPVEPKADDTKPDKPLVQTEAPVNDLAYKFGDLKGGKLPRPVEGKRKLLFEPGSIGRALDALLFWDSPDYAPLSKSEPLLYQNNYVDLQADRNEVAGNIRELERLVSNNPSALGAITATAYDANNKINQQERNFNTQNRQQIYNANVETINKYNAVNQQLADQEMTRNFMADEMTKQNNRNLMAKMLTEIRQDRLQNRQLELYKRLIPNVNLDVYDPSQITFNTEGVNLGSNVYSGQMSKENEAELIKQLKGLDKKSRETLLKSAGYSPEDIEKIEKEVEKEYGGTIS